MTEDDLSAADATLPGGHLRIASPTQGKKFYYAHFRMVMFSTGSCSLVNNGEMGKT
jgi:hypothetical protein